MSSRGTCLAGTLVGALACIGFAAASAQATFPGANGKIAFVSDRDGNPEVYIMDADGTDQTNLTTNAASDGQTDFNTFDVRTWDGPSFSPDGQQIAFTSNRSGSPDIWVMDADGSNQTRLTTDGGFDTNPTFTSDGDIVFVSDRGGGLRNLWIMGPDGSSQAILPSSAGLSQPDAIFAPPVQAFAVTGPAANFARVGTYVLTPPPSGLLSSGASDFSVTPEAVSESGTPAIYYTDASPPGGDFDLYKGGLDFASPTNVTNTPSFNEVDPAPAPTGSAAGGIAYAGHGVDPDWEIYVGATQLTTNDAEDTAPEWQALDATPPDTEILSGPTGDPDGIAPFATNDRTPTFTFSSNEEGSTFRCSLDEGTAHFTDCNGAGGSHTPSASLADGTYAFRVRATDRAGNADPSPAERTFRVDTEGPTVNITQPRDDTIVSSKKRVKVKFVWDVSEAGSTSTCQLDNGALEECVSGDKITMTRGKHNVTITATDAVGNKGPGNGIKVKIVTKS